jgi:hypothetical protein
MIDPPFAFIPRFGGAFLCDLGQWSLFGSVFRGTDNPKRSARCRRLDNLSSRNGHSLAAHCEALAPISN